MTQPASSRIPRPPIVTVMGHIDHGKSTLLDYIRKSNVTATEAGGITQHLSAYEVVHSHEGVDRRITFLDTPGHEAFQHLRNRGSSVADLAILVVAADDGVKPQTLQALKAIEEAKLPFIVALSKIDKPNADVDRAKVSLLEAGVYLEGMGGDIPYAAIDSKSGRGIRELLDLLLLAADLQELTGDPSKPAEGYVIESHCDPKKGMSAVLIIRDGSLKTGEYVVAGNASAPLRIVEDCWGAKLTNATFSTPVLVVGWSEVPPVGAPFTTYTDKVTARARALAASSSECAPAPAVDENETRFVLPVVLKADVVGSLEAVRHELMKANDEYTVLRVVHAGVGAVSESDLKYVTGCSTALIIGFNVPVDERALELAARAGHTIDRFSIIYELSDWLPGAIHTRRPKVTGEVELARVKVLKGFSASKKSQTVGLRVEHGTLEVKQRIRAVRGTETLGEGRVESLQSGRNPVPRIEEGYECGAVLDLSLEHTLVYGDEIIAYTYREQ